MLLRDVGFVLCCRRSRRQICPWRDRRRMIILLIASCQPQTAAQNLLREVRMRVALQFSSVRYARWERGCTRVMSK